MKKIITFLLMLGYLSLNAQNTADKFTTGSNDQPHNPRVDQMNFVPNEVLVKFKDEVSLSSAARLRSAGLSAVDKVLQANGVDSLVRLFPTSRNSLLRSSGVARIVKDPQGRDMKIPNLDKIYKITLPQLRSTSSTPVNIFQVINDLKALPEVEYAEPNYIYSVDDLQPVGPVLTTEDVKKMQSGLRSTQAAVVPNDPLYAQQWYIPAVKADLVWEQITGDTTQVIGILDTGVDWNHPDLKNKIWTNPGEIPGNGRDDDGNGLIDDIRGWDYINNDNNPMDDNSHGTHVAGIAAAETNNGIGISGVNWQAKIMPVKVFSSKGTANISEIVQGINYAVNQGALVLNMSFGGYSRSLTMEAALANATLSSLLVAAAGNDGYSIYANHPSGFPAIFYPAALAFVFGVQSDGAYSNYDPDGPVYSEINGLNYELKAPGSLLSTTPNGNYKILSGTSMATPIISGAMALYRSLFPNKTLEELWSDFIYSSNGLVDLNTAFFSTEKKPHLDLLKYAVNDSSGGNDNDGDADAGEIVDIVVQLRNTGAPARGVYALIKHIDGDTNDITILNDSVYFGNIGIFRTLINDSRPFKVQINKDCYHNRNITMEITMGCDGNSTTTQKINFRIFNGREISGILLKDTTLTPGFNWVVSNSLRISQNVTLTILPGTSIEIMAGVDNRGKVVAVGASDKRISMKGFISGNALYKFVDIDANGGGIGGYNDYNTLNIDNCNIRNFSGIYANLVTYTQLVDLDPVNSTGYINCDSIYRCNLRNCRLDGTFDCKMYESTIENFSIYRYFPLVRESEYSIYHKLNSIFQMLYPNSIVASNYPANLFSYSGNARIVKNTFLENGVTTTFFNAEGSADMISLPEQYWGTTNNVRIKTKYKDFTDNAGAPFLNIEPKLVVPSDSCPGFVWKVLVNGIDAQDGTPEPVGVGMQRFDVYFNRAMNKTIPPKVSFGGIYPYTSNPINENPSWSEDGKIYTVFKTIKLTTGDGINQIRVAGAKQAGDWGWEIPVEDNRFDFTISATNSASLEFQATPGLGKVALEWNNNDLEDGLGYNMYRMEHINDSTLTDATLINNSLITDTLYTDYSVVPSKKYYYYFKIVRTDLSETNSSKVVSAIPFTASKGDANGDLSVNVLDITTIVAFLLNNNPQPFITEAADLNSDGNINVLDIVGVVNKVLFGGLRAANSEEIQQASLYLQNDTLFADASTAIGGLQFDVNGISSITDIQVLDALQVFESGYSQRDSTTLRLLYYSMSGKSIASGSRIPLLKIKKSCNLLNAIVSDKGGYSIPVSLSDPTIGNRNNQGLSVAELGQNYPNPSKGQTTLPVQIFEKVDDASIGIYNMLGQQVKVLKLDNPTVGKHEIPWNSSENKGIFIYKLEIRIGGQQFVSPLKKMIVL